MSDHLRDRIAAVFGLHRIEAWPLTYRCSCLPDAWLASREDCQLHLADAVIAELGLRYEPCYDDGSYRYVTDWED